MTDEISLSRSVMFVGDFFSLITTVVIDPKDRGEDEDEGEQAIREASAFMVSHYGWNVYEASNEVGVLDEWPPE